MNEAQGMIIKGIGGFYYVRADHQTFECKASGRLRLGKLTPITGDWVRFSFDDSLKTGYILEILPRKNALLRPPVANVDQFVLVISASTPHPDFLLCDKLAIQAKKHEADLIFVVNKSDQGNADAFAEIVSQYSRICRCIIACSAKTGEGINELEEELRSKTSCFAGQSAVGKSSLINALCKSLHLETGGLSKKTARGKHTTRETTLFPLDGLEGYIMDTPGFNFFDLNDIDSENIQKYYPEYETYYGKCRFINCNHISEPDCAVKNAALSGEISKKRYERYQILFAETLSKEKKQFT